MPRKFAVSLIACCVAVALAVATADAAQSAPSLMGATRDQVLSRYGEPKSQIAVGNRLIMFFERERVILRDGIVVEVERLAAEPARRSAPPPAPATAPAATAAPAEAPATAGSTTNATSTPAPAAAPSAAPAAGAVAPVPAETGIAGAPTTGAPVAVTTPPPPPPPEPKLEIKLVRPPSANFTRSPAKTDAATAAAPSEKRAGSEMAERPAGKLSSATVTQPVKAQETSSPLETALPSVANAVATTEPEVKPAADSVPTTEPPPAEQVAAEQPVAEPPAVEEPAEEVTAAKKKAAKKSAARRRSAEGDMYDPTPDVFTTQTYVIAFFVVAGGIGYLIWRSRQRQLELAATAVSRTPFSMPVVSASGGGAVFTADFLGKLEWKRFEELVAAYYSKTGVVAVRTKTGPASPVHIKISWKGEPRPFAGVQCIAHPLALIDAAPLQELAANIAAEDIRRGYVVSTGKFNVNARDFAEEKHITLLPGDIFLEKLNALPDAARSEIMQTITAGDFTTPSCPKCDAKMVRSADYAGKWHCPTHSDVSIVTRA